MPTLPFTPTPLDVFVLPVGLELPKTPFNALFA
jgi:hypothetical protein